MVLLSRSVEQMRWHRSVALQVLAWAHVVLAPTIQSLLSPSKSRQGVGEAVNYSPIAQAVGQLTTMLLLAVCLWCIVESINDLPRRGTLTLMVILLPWVYIAIRQAYVPQPLQNKQLVYPLLALAIWIIRPKMRDLQVMGYLIAGTALLAVILGAFMPEIGLLRLSSGDLVKEDKDILGIGYLQGMFSHSNTAGAFFALGMPTITMIRNVWARWGGLAITMFALLWSASRTSLEAVIAAAVITLIIGVSARALRPMFTMIVGVLLMAASASLPFVTHSWTAFTNRGYIWYMSLLHWHESPVFGLGPTFYSDIAKTSATLGRAVFHGHNETVHLLTTGGIVMAVLVALLILWLAGCAGRLSQTTSLFGIGFLVTLIICCTLEISLSFIDNFFVTPIVTVPMFFVMLSQERFGAGSQVGRGRARRSTAPSMGASTSAAATPELTASELEPARG